MFEEQDIERPPTALSMRLGEMVQKIEANCPDFASEFGRLATEIAIFVEQQENIILQLATRPPVAVQLMASPERLDLPRN